MPVFTPHLLSSWFRPLRAGLALVLLTVPLAGFAQSTVRTDHGSAAAISIQLELAHQMQSAGRLQDAETMLGTLLEQTRANLGLFDPAQFAILEQLANTPDAPSATGLHCCHCWRITNGLPTVFTGMPPCNCPISSHALPACMNTPQ